VPFELPSNLHPKLMPVAWLIGDWAGAGVIGYPSMESDLQFGQEVSFGQDGRPFLTYTSLTWLLDDAGEKVRPLASETGYWRVGPGSSAPEELEVLLTHPTGFVEIYVGRVDGACAELVTDLVARTSTAKDYRAAKRMYGLVEGDLMWVMEMTAVGHEMAPHASARLKRL
jgi:hypothetical protein